jgi:replicative DNA helicase
MSEIRENTLSAYKGPEFQQRLMWQLLVEPEYAEKTLPNLAVEYFDDPNLKRLFIIILEYFKRYEKVPNLQNQSIHQAINEFKTPNNKIEEESLFGVLKRIDMWNERIINKQMHYDGDVVQKATAEFIKQQEYRKLAEHITEKVKSGDIRNKFEISNIEERFQKVSHIGEEEDDCEEVTEGIDKALRKEFRKTIPTGIEVIDALTGGGLGKSEIGVILTPSGVGKTTALTVIANTAYEDERNVAQVIFEDTKDQIKRKHYTIWAKSALSKIDEEEENIRVNKIAHEKAESLRGKGRLIIKRFSQENTTIRDVKNWMISYQKKYGFKFDLLVLDYLDCLESHKKSPDRNEAELAIIKGFEALAAEFDIPAWTAIQSNRSGFDAEFVEAHQTGGSIKRIQKAHFFMSVAKTKDQKEAQLANIRIIKARFAADGQTFQDCIFNNDTMEIRIEDDRYKSVKMYNGQKHHDETDVDKIENTANKLHAEINKTLEKINDDSINSSPTIKDVIMEDMLKKFTEQNKFEGEKKTESIILTGDITKLPNTLEKVNFENIHIETTRTDLSETEIKQIVDIANEAINETEIFELDGAIEGATEGAIEGINKVYGIDAEEEMRKIMESEATIFDWNGKSGSTTNEIINQPEVKIEDVKPLQPPTGTTEAVLGALKHEINKEKAVKPFTYYNVSEAENKFEDPDEIYDVNKSIRNMLIEERKNQNVIKKE